MLNIFMKTLNVFVCAAFMLQLTGCGTIMYPERKGQKSGRIDSGVAFLDGLGLLFFLVPGVIAFAIDFNNGTIYLPGTSASALDIRYMKKVKFDPRRDSISGIEEIIKKETGYEVKLYQDGTLMSEMQSVDDMMRNFAQFSPNTEEDVITLLDPK